MSQTQPLSEGDVQRWTAKRKAAVVLDLIRGKTTPADAARQHGLTVTSTTLGKLPEQWPRFIKMQSVHGARIYQF